VELSRASRISHNDANRIARINTFIVGVKPVIANARAVLQLAYKIFEDGLGIFDPEDPIGKLYFDPSPSPAGGTDALSSRNDTLALFISVLNTACIHALPAALAHTQNIVNKTLNFKKIDSFDLHLNLFDATIKVTQNTGTDTSNTTDLQVLVIYIYLILNVFGTSYD
jgi:hypothetical protein